MFITDNLIDKKLTRDFSSEVIESIEIGQLDYLGMNFSSKPESDVDFKIYYAEDYSWNIYEDYKDDSFISFLAEREMIQFFSAVRYKGNEDRPRFDARIERSYNENMLALFSYLEENIEFFHKYKDEILKLSLMKNRDYEGYDYASLYFISMVKVENKIDTLKCYWLNKMRENHEFFNNEYYLKFIEESGVTGLVDLLPVVKEALKNCGANLCIEGIDYTKDCAKKHKFYIRDGQDILGGLAKTFSEYQNLTDKIKIIQDWMDKHPEFFCDGAAIGKNTENDFVLNLYFKFKKQKESE